MTNSRANSNLILFGCFWNEKDWIEASLEQIRAINPDEVILCDGCFDLDMQAHSTDGTYEIIRNEVKKYDNYHLVEPVRLKKRYYHRYFPRLISDLDLSGKYLLPLLKFYASLYKYSRYRVNQALTFNKMVSLSRLWKSGNWVMTYDCDQFYSDQNLEIFKNLDKYEDFELLTADEYTFFESFDEYTDKWMERKHSNMPHKIKESTVFVPTRRIVYLSNFGKYEYSKYAKKCHIGNYFHYKLNKGERLKKGYKLGDRKKDIPEYDHLEFKKIRKEFHPELVKKNVFEEMGL